MPTTCIIGNKPVFLKYSFSAARASGNNCLIFGLPSRKAFGVIAVISASQSPLSSNSDSSIPGGPCLIGKSDGKKYLEPPPSKALQPEPVSSPLSEDFVVSIHC